MSQKTETGDSGKESLELRASWVAEIQVVRKDWHGDFTISLYAFISIIMIKHCFNLR